jgi:hypothetical protein
VNKSKPNSNPEQAQMWLRLEGLKPIEQSFDGGEVCSDGGLLLLRKADERLDLLEMAACCIFDNRRPHLVKHTLIDLFRQRVYGIAAGYEDCNDANKLRRDAMFQLALGKEPGNNSVLANQSTLSRFEAMADATSNLALQRLFRHLWVRRHKKPPKVVRLAIDTSFDTVYGYQQLSFYNGFAEAYCYQPLFIFTDCGFPLCALLRPGNPSPIDDTLRMLKEIVKDLRLSWPNVRFEVTADAAFSSPEIFQFCESENITYFISVASHPGLAYHAETLIFKCKSEFDSFGYDSPELKKYAALVNPKERKKAWRQREERIRYSTKKEGRMQEHFEDDLHVRKYGEFHYQSREWDRERRFIFRVDYTKAGPDTRFVVTNAERGKARWLYDQKYCKRARVECWIKDLKTYLKCDRTSCQEFDANQFRLLLHTLAYVLIWDIRKRASLPPMTVETFRLQLLKIGVLVTVKCRQIKLSLASNFVWRDQFERAWSGG